ncbi:MAG: aldose 1-epimerase family protein [Verrucomicrobia bacterium]|nr:MAG: aldose 1-epimerase family protein [Verrucomicrobiota bacterium]
MSRIHEIQNSQFKVSIQQTGAELCSIQSLGSGKEYIWGGNPDVWAAHAPNLFPVIGRLKNGAFVYRGKEYPCPKHGFIRKNENIVLLEKTRNSLSFGLNFSEQTLEIYPFKFEFIIKYLLEGSQVVIEHTITNAGEEPMLFALGGHPGFACPLNEDESYTDYYLEFEKPETAETWCVQKDGLISTTTQPAFDEPTIINLHPDIFMNDALVFKNLNSSKVSLKSRKSKQVLSVCFEGFPYLGIWAKPGAEFVCIEPWIGIADRCDTDRDFETKEALVKLSPAKSFAATYSIGIEEYA